MLAAEAYTRDLPRAFVGYDALLADWRSEVARIEAAHAAPLPRLTDAAGKKIDRFLTPELRHNAGEDGLLALGWAGDIAARTHAWFAERAAGGEPDPAALRTAAEDLAQRAAEIAPLGLVRDLATARAEALAQRERATAAEALQAELRDEMARQREVLEGGWRGDIERLQIARAAMSRINAELDAALAEE
jgi:hypothetical protein